MDSSPPGEPQVERGRPVPRREKPSELIIGGPSRGTEMGLRTGPGKKRENREMWGNARIRHGLRRT